MKRLLLLSVLFIGLATQSFAANTSISNGDSGSSVRTKLNTQFNQQFNVKQPPYNAVGDGTSGTSGTDDTAAIQAAITDAITAGGGTVFLPPLSAHCYRITQPLTFTGGSGSNLVTIAGAKGFNSNGSRLCADFGGTSVNVTGAANNGSGAVRLTVSSTAAFTSGYYIRVASVGGTTEANGVQAVTVVDGTHLDIVGSTFAHAYTSGGAATVIGYVINEPFTGGGSNLQVIDGIMIENINAAGGGVRWGNQVTGRISDCHVSAGSIGIFMDGAYNITVNNCNIIGISGDGIGVIAQQATLQGNSFTGWNPAVQVYNGGTAIIGNRFEVNTTGLIIGKSAGTSSQASGTIVSGNTGERNNTTVYVLSGGGLIMAGNAWTGTVGVDGIAPPLYGMVVINCTACSFSGEVSSVLASVAGVDISGATGSNIAFVGSTYNAGTGATWLMPTSNLAAFSFTGSNNPAAVLLFANLPTPIQGMVFDVSNCTIAGSAWGGTVTNGGGGGVPCRVYYNGTNWTAMGK